MIAIENLVEDAGELYASSLECLGEVFRELSDIELVIQSLINTAIDMGEKLDDLTILRIEPTFPVGEGKEEAGFEKDTVGHFQSINNYLISIYAENIYSLSETITDAFEAFNMQTAGIARVFSPHDLLEKKPNIEPGIFSKLTATSRESLLKETHRESEEKIYTYPISSETEKLYTDLRKSTLVTNEFKNICKDFASITAEKEDFPSERVLIFNRSGSFIEEGVEDIRRNEILDAKNFASSVNHFFEIIKDSTESLYTGISTLQEINSLSIDRNPEGYTELTSSKNVMNTYSPEESIGNSNIISNLLKATEMVSSVELVSSLLGESISKTGAFGDASSFKSSIVKIPESIPDYSETAEKISLLSRSISEQTSDLLLSDVLFKTIMEVSELSINTDAVSPALNESISKTRAFADVVSFNGLPLGTSESMLDYSGTSKTISSLNRNISEQTMNLLFNSVSFKTIKKASDISKTIGTVSSALNESFSGTMAFIEASSFNDSSIRILENILGYSGTAKISSSLDRNISEQKSSLLFNDTSFKTITEVSDLSKTTEAMSSALNGSISKTRALKDIPLLSKTSTESSASVTINPEQKIIYPDQRIFEIPPLRPKMAQEDAAINTSRLSGAISNQSPEIEKRIYNRTGISPAAIYSASSQPASQFYLSNAFEAISEYLTIAGEIGNQMSEMTQKGIAGADNMWQDYILNLMLPDGGRTALALGNLASRDSKMTAGIKMMDIALGMAAASMPKSADSSVITNISPALFQDYHMLSAPVMPHTVESMMQILGSWKDTPGGSHQNNNNINIQNAFNIVINVRDGGEETELRDLGRKIGQILSDEIRRYGGTW